ncbi:hypothetical protein F4780DRAFT_729065, partial [Xylariomycetidae sp. FL0641]
MLVVTVGTLRCLGTVQSGLGTVMDGVDKVSIRCCVARRRGHTICSPRLWCCHWILPEQMRRCLTPRLVAGQAASDRTLG